MIFIVDVSGRVVEYDIGLFDAISKVKKDEDIRLLIADAPKINSNVIRMLRLIPTRFKSSENKVKRIGKAVETLLNYIYIGVLCLLKRPSVIHFQWFPFLEFCSIDNYFVSFIKVLRPNIKIVLTVHNIYPHEMSPARQEKYRRRFMKLAFNIEHFIVHVENSKEQMITEYGINQDRISVIPHGVFAPNYKPTSSVHSNNHHIIMYGNLTPYKGADILMEALQLLPEDEKSKVKLTIAGRMTDEYLLELKSKSEGINVNYIPSFIPDGQLYKLIDESDIIALPYRKISQSGVLLLALFFEKPLLLSNLPSFVETLKGFTADMFFDSNNPSSLRDLMMRHFLGQIDVNKQLDIIAKLKDLYSWHNSAKQTLALYKKIDNNQNFDAI